MRILLKNLRALPYSLDVGEWDYGAMVRELLAPVDQPGDTYDLGDRVDAWDVNVQALIRRLVVPDGSTRVITQLVGGYRVTAVPPGQLSATFLGEPNDLVFLFTGSDHKVGVSSLDTGPDFLDAKLVAGIGIALTTLNPGANEQIEIATTGAASLPTPTNAGQFLYAAALDAFTREIPVVTTSGVLAVTINGFVAVRGP